MELHRRVFAGYRFARTNHVKASAREDKHDVMRAYQVSSVLPDERPLPAARLCCSFVSAAAAAAAHLVHTAQPRSPAAGPARLLRPRSHCPGTARPCLCSSCLSPCLRSRSFPSSSPACPSLRPCNSATPCHLLHPFSAYYALLLPRILPTCIITPSPHTTPPTNPPLLSPPPVSPAMQAKFSQDSPDSRLITPKPTPPSVPLPHPPSPSGTDPPSAFLVHQLRPRIPAPSLPSNPGTFQKTPEDFPHPYNVVYMSGNASKTTPHTMSDSRPSGSTSEPARSGPRGRSYSGSTPSRRQLPRQPFQTPSTTAHYPTAHPSGSLSSHLPPSSASSPSFQGLPAQYQAGPVPYGQRGGFVGPYTLSAQPHVGIMHQSPQYAYPHHPGLHAPDTSIHPAAQNPLLGYSPNTLVPIMQPQSPAVYPYPHHSSEGSASSSHSFSGGAGPPALFTPSSLSHSHSHPHSPAHSSPSPHSPLPPQGPPAHAPPPHSAPYAGQTPYAPLRYPTPPFAFPPHSFAPSPPLYQSQYPQHYPQHYPPTPAEPEGQGTWWYVPPAARSASAQYDSFQGPYALSFSPVPARDVEPYAPQGPAPAPVPASMYPMSPRANPAPYSPRAPAPTPPRPASAGPPVARYRPPEAGPSTPASSRPATERAPVRRTYHPQPPAQRSEWVMWVGNVPADTTHDELWRLLSRAPAPASAAAPTPTPTPTPAPEPEPEPEPEPAAAAAGDVWGGVLSIFLISRSNCAFVNFQTAAHLHAAIRHFNGQPLRAGDPRCPRLVCRVRGRDDDLKAGVGGQRGAGIHVRWVRGQKERARVQGQDHPAPRSPRSEHVSTPSSSPGDPAPMLASLSLSSDDEGARLRGQPHSSSSGSYASTSSSILVQYFPKRYFILKSLTQEDLETSVKEGLWATQRHNEGTLDQAFRTSKEVYLVFGVNKSGEFYGYARMTGPITHGERRVSWASRDSPPQRRTARPSQPSSQASSPPTARVEYATFFSPAEQRYEESPLPVSPSPPAQQQEQQQELEPPLFEEGATPRTSMDVLGRTYLSAPPELHQPHHQLSRPSAGSVRPPQVSLDARQLRAPAGFELDRAAPIRALRERSAPPEPSGSRDVIADDDDARRREWEKTMQEKLLDPVAEEEERHGAGAGREGDRRGQERVGEEGGEAAEGQAGAAREGPVWGEPFKVQWIRTDRLPFHRTRHLRNPWNHDREVKVSRDGTELEPSVGQALLDEWDKPAPAPPTSPSGERRSGSKGAAGEASGSMEGG
ncbi:hypothetical protein AcV5_007896 [Taiwanofungus camphoratus]|nr:hypothetical protein AcV5_007896 [Antrodia cinnamomea]